MTIHRARSTLLVTVNTFCACVYFAANGDKLSFLFIVLMGHISYEPADLTVHPPPPPQKNERGRVHFFRIGV